MSWTVGEEAEEHKRKGSKAAVFFFVLQGHHVSLTLAIKMQFYQTVISGFYNVTHFHLQLIFAVSLFMK